jgi:hypothetical protein
VSDADHHRGLADSSLFLSLPVDIDQNTNADKTEK